MRQKEKNKAKKHTNKQTPTKQNKDKKIYGVKTLNFYALRYYRMQSEICVLCLQENHHLVDYNTAAFVNS